MRPTYDPASVFANQIHTAESESSKVFEPLIGVVTDNKDLEQVSRVKVKILISIRPHVLVPDRHARRRQEPRVVLHPREEY